MGIFENRDKPKYVTCVAFTQNGDVITGDSHGNLIVWGRGTNTICKFMRNVHEGSVFSVCVLKEGNIISGGGKDGRLIQFDAQLNRTGEEAQVSLHLFECFVPLMDSSLFHLFRSKDTLVEFVWSRKAVVHK